MNWDHCNQPEVKPKYAHEWCYKMESLNLLQIFFCPIISVVIPCKNEEVYIQNCIDALLAQGSKEEVEVIVVDNGSTDNTIKILKQYENNIRLFSLPVGTISEVRNFGASHARGEWIAFIDGDVVVNEDWLASFYKFVKSFDKSQTSKLITGSTCSIRKKPTWIEKIWFEQLARRDQQNNEYINSGHLIISRLLFYEIGGFDKTFETGEDEKLCKDTIELGGTIRKEPSIKAIHYGYPKNIKAFFKRERWHGRGMKNHFETFWKYRDLLLALYILTLLPLGVLLVFWGLPMIAILIAILILWIGPLFVLSFFRSKTNVKSFFLLTLLFIVYTLAKAIAVLDVVIYRPRFSKR